MLSAIKTAAYFEEISGHNYSAIVNCITHYLLVPSIKQLSLPCLYNYYFCKKDANFT